MIYKDIHLFSLKFSCLEKKQLTKNISIILDVTESCIRNKEQQKYYQLIHFENFHYLTLYFFIIYFKSIF